MQTIIKYECDYCKTSYDFALHCQMHENQCDKNPNVKSCGTCDIIKGFFGNVQARIFDCKKSHNDDSKGAWKKHCEHWQNEEE